MEYFKTLINGLKVFVNKQITLNNKKITEQINNASIKNISWINIKNKPSIESASNSTSILINNP